MRTTGRLTAILLGTLLLTVAASPAASAQDPDSAGSPSPICDLLTAPEVSEALGVDVSITDGWDVTCVYDSSDPSGEFFSVSSNVDPATLADRKLVFTGETIDVDGREALYSDDTVPTLFVTTPDGGTWTLLVIGTTPDGVDAMAAMTGLARLAMSRMAAGSSPAETPSVPAPTSAMCSLLEAAEISDALGEEVAITEGDDVECTYETGEGSAETLLVSSRRSADTLDDQRGFFEGEDIEVGGAAALFVPGVFSRELYVSTPDGGSYTLQVVGVVGEDVDLQAAMTGLATLAMSRLPAIGPLPTEEPADAGQTFAGDPELEAKFPAQIGGAPVTVSSFSLADAGTEADVPPALQTALDAAGKTLADVRVGFGFAQSSAGAFSSITAVQVQGADASALTSALLPTIYPGQTMGPETAQQIGGKDVTSVDLEGTLTYLYPKDDILWAVTAVEPALTEIFQSLP